MQQVKCHVCGELINPLVEPEFISLCTGELEVTGGLNFSNEIVGYRVVCTNCHWESPLVFKNEEVAYKLAGRVLGEY
jgi:hypothetical protein